MSLKAQESAKQKGIFFRQWMSKVNFVANKTFESEVFWFEVKLSCAVFWNFVML